MITVKQTKLINTIWSDLQERFNNISWNHYGDRLLELTRAETKAHSNFMGEFGSRGLSQITEAKYFAVLRVVECAMDKRVPDVRDFVSTQQSAFYAASLALSYPEVVEAWAQAHQAAIEEFRTYDYVELNATAA
jgi:hypothetical protein